MEQMPSGREGFSLSKLKGESLKEIIVQFIKFGVVGLSNTAISLGVYYLCVYVFHWHYQVGNVLGFILSVTNAYFWNSRYVFKMGKRRTFTEHCKTYIKTVVAYGSTFLLSTALLWLWVDVLGISEGLAPIINLIITIPLNFVINKFWTFRKKADAQQAAPERAAETGAVE